MAVPHASQPSIKAWSVQTLELLNIAPFLHGDEDARLEFARSLASSLRTFGMAKLRTDQLPGCKVQTLFDMVSP
jgi:isopenicillin N synthase-like dioxygenase